MASSVGVMSSAGRPSFWAQQQHRARPGTNALLSARPAARSPAVQAEKRSLGSRGAATPTRAASGDGRAAKAEGGGGGGGGGEAAAVSTLEEGLKQLDQYLEPMEGTTAVKDETAAVELAGRLKDAGLALGFGGARQVPKRTYTLDELRLNSIHPENLLSPQDKTLDGISDKLTLAAVLGVGTLAYTQHWDASQLLGCSVAVLFALTADQVAAGGGISALLLDTAGRALSPTYKRRVAAHEAGHFLIAYLLGLLPQAYTLSALEAYQRYKAFNVQAGTVFCDKEFQTEVATGKITSGTLDRYTCVALAGVATEYLQYGMAEGGMGDVQQLDGLLRALNFTQAKADGQIRWAVLNTIALLRRHEAVHAKLADAMLEGASVGQAIAVVEGALSPEDLVPAPETQGEAAEQP